MASNNNNSKTSAEVKDAENKEKDIFFRHAKDTTVRKAAASHQLYVPDKKKEIDVYEQEYNIGFRLYESKALRCCNCGLEVSLKIHGYEIVDPQDPFTKSLKEKKDYIRLPIHQNIQSLTWEYDPDLVCCTFECAGGYMIRSTRWVEVMELLHINISMRYGFEKFVCVAPPLHVFAYTHHHSHQQQKRDKKEFPWATGLLATSFYNIVTNPFLQIVTETVMGAVPQHANELIARLRCDRLPSLATTRYYYTDNLPKICLDQLPDASQTVAFDANPDNDANDIGGDYVESKPFQNLNLDDIQKKLHPSNIGLYDSLDQMPPPPPDEDNL